MSCSPGNPNARGYRSPVDMFPVCQSASVSADMEDSCALLADGDRLPPRMGQWARHGQEVPGGSDMRLGARMGSTTKPAHARTEIGLLGNEEVDVCLCPRCGGWPALRRDYDGDLWYWFECPECGFMPGMGLRSYETGDEALHAWNSGAEEEARHLGDGGHATGDCGSPGVCG